MFSIPSKSMKFKGPFTNFHLLAEATKRIKYSIVNQAIQIDSM